jgi:hypothetical protein
MHEGSNAYDVITCGTGFKECLLSALLSVAGKKVLIAFYEECMSWVRSANSKLKLIRTQFRQELKRIEKLQALEFNESFPPTTEPEAEPEDLNTVIADALASHARKRSPADYPSSRGYGDSAESTR